MGAIRLLTHRRPIVPITRLLIPCGPESSTSHRIGHLDSLQRPESKPRGRRCSQASISFLPHQIRCEMLLTCPGAPVPVAYRAGGQRTGQRRLDDVLGAGGVGIPSACDGSSKDAWAFRLNGIVFTIKTNAKTTKNTEVYPSTHNHRAKFYEITFAMLIRRGVSSILGD
jgi:hypothetical protein